MVQENKQMKKVKRKNKPKKYICIAKIGNKSDGKAKCVTYRSNDLQKHSAFLDSNFPTWTWCNVYLKETSKQVTNFTKYNTPVGKDG